MKDTPLQKAIAEIETRIKYLRETEFKCIAELDNLPSPSFKRDMKWKLIHELAARRGELEMYSLKPLQSLLPYERECIEETYNNGAMCDMNVRENKDGTHTQVHLSAHDYFNQTYNQ